MSNVHNHNYITIQGWMINELHLSGTELMVYAIIYGFSQDDGSVFSGSRQYLADWCNCTTRCIQTVLNNLVDAKLLTKYEYTKNNVKFCEYVANFTPSEKSSLPSEKSSLNKLEDKKDSNTISKDIVQTETETDKPKKKSLYEKCVDSILAYTEDENLQTALIEYLKIRLAIKEKPIRGLPQWNALLKKLSTLKGNAVQIVDNATANGWASFYENNNSSYKQKSILDISSETKEMQGNFKTKEACEQNGLF